MQSATQRALAEELLSDAFAHQYRYPDDYPGFSALCRFRDDFGECDATVAMTSARDAAAVPSLGVSPPRVEWLLQDLRSLARTLWRHDYAIGEGRFAKTLDESPHPLGILISLLDDPHEATFRVRKQRITMATRREGELTQTLRIDRWHVRPDGRWVPAQWVSEVWDEALVHPLERARYWDLYWPVGGELVPQMRRVDATDDLGVTVGRSINLAEWQLAQR